MLQPAHTMDVLAADLLVLHDAWCPTVDGCGWHLAQCLSLTMSMLYRMKVHAQTAGLSCVLLGACILYGEVRR